MAAHIYWRALATKTYASYGAFGCSAIEMASSISGADLCTGGTATSSSSYNAANLPENAFDQNNATMWASTSTPAPHWIAYQFAAAVDIKQVRYKARSDDNGDQSPVDIAIQYSDNGSTWVDAAVYTYMAKRAASAYLMLTVNSPDISIGEARLSVLVQEGSFGVPVGSTLVIAESRMNVIEGGAPNKLGIGEVRMNVLLRRTLHIQPQIY